MEYDDDGGRYAAYLADRQSDAWTEFAMTGRPSALAAYLEAEGEVDDPIGRILIDILRNGPVENNAGGKDRWRDYVTYVEVRLVALRDLSKTAACKQYADKTNQELRAVEKQYERGSKVFTKGCDVFKRVDPDNET